MKRTQIQLDERIWGILRERAFHEKRSIADVVREMLHMDIEERPKPRRVFSFSFVGSGTSRGRGRGRIAERHDEALGEALLRDHAL